MLKEQRVKARGRHEHMPALNLTLTPRGRRAVPHKAMKRHTSELARELQQASQRKGKADNKEVTLSEDFKEAAGQTDSGSESAGGSTKAPEKKSKGRIRSRRRQRDRGKVNLTKDFVKAATPNQTASDTGSASSDGHKSVSEQKIRRSRRRRRDHDPDRGR